MSGGRKERMLDPGSGPLAAFALDLRRLRSDAGLTYRQMASVAKYSHNALSQAAGGQRLPSLEVTLAYAKACGGDSRLWERHWYETRNQLHHQPPPGPRISREQVRLEADEWAPLGAGAPVERFAAYLRRQYGHERRPIDRLGEDSGVAAEAIRTWMNAQALPASLEDLRAVLKAMHAPAGGVQLTEKLFTEARAHGYGLKQPSGPLTLRLRWGPDLDVIVKGVRAGALLGSLVGLGAALGFPLAHALRRRDI